MATAKEEAQAERLATNAENQRKQDAFGLAEARRSAAVLEEDGVELAEETRKLHAEELKADQEIQTLNDTSVDDDALVSAAVDEELDAYVEKNVVVHGVDEAAEAPEDAAYAPEGADGEVLPIGDVSDEAEAEIEAASDDKE